MLTYHLRARLLLLNRYPNHRHASNLLPAFLRNLKVLQRTQVSEDVPRFPWSLAITTACSVLTAAVMNENELPAFFAHFFPGSFSGDKTAQSCVLSM